MAGFKDALTNIMEDLTDRIMEGDHNIISGVSKFILALRNDGEVTCTQLFHFICSTQLLESQSVSQ